jgi:tyrosyl-tRNA synthetase
VADLNTAAGQFAYLTEGCIDVVREDELKARLAKSIAQKKPLVIKAGFDPSSADIHLGHVVLMRKMKQFQDCGHTVVFVVGDFTAMIGDPTGRSKTRPQLTREQIVANAETYRRQAAKILDDAKTEFRYNGEWLTALGSVGLVKLAARYNVARMLERRDFRQRFDAGLPIAVHEFLYPLAQAYDSVALKADVELGGTDQLFNLNVGRDIMPEYELAPQIVMTTPLLEGLDGVEKMSKSLGNYVAVEDPPQEMFGKLMSVSDALMWKYWTLLGGVSPGAVDVARLAAGADAGGAGEGEDGAAALQRAIAEGLNDDKARHEEEIRNIERGGGIVGEEFELHRAKVSELGQIERAAASLAASGVKGILGELGAPSFHPKALKTALAKKIVSDFHGREAAIAAEGEFARIFSNREMPAEMEEAVRPLAKDGAWLPKLMADLGLAKSNGEAVRLIQQGAVTIDGERIDSKDHRLAADAAREYVLKVGKRRFVRVQFR